MTALIAAIPPRTTPPTTTFRLRDRSFIRVREGLWRVVDQLGTVIGYIETRSGVEGDRYSARRIVFATRTSELGVFCRLDEAADCFR
jgi:hypothetical protein